MSFLSINFIAEKRERRKEEKTLRKRVYAISLALLILAMALQTSFAFAQWTEDDETYESFGPRVDQLIYRSYPAGVDALMLALEAGEVDFAVWETPAEYVDKWSNNAPYNDPNDDDYMKMVDFSDIGQREFDLNHKERVGGGLDGSYPSTYPDWRSPTSYKSFRQALAHLANRTYYITEILEGWAVEMWSPIMPWTFWFETACEGAFPTSLASARALLDADGFTKGSTTNPVDPSYDNIRVYPAGHEKAGADLDPLLFYIRSDDPFRYQAGLHMATNMEKVGLPVSRKIGPSSYCYFPVFWHQDYHLYTGGWSLGIDPDYIYALYGGVYIDWPNYCWYNSTAFDAEAGDNLFYATTMAQALAGCKAAQMIAWGPGGDVCNIPLWTAVAQSTRRGYYNPAELLPDETGTGPYAGMIGKPWEGWVNGEGAGFGSYSTVHPKDYDSGGILRIGQNQAPIKLNILKSEWYYEYNILLLSYDFLMTVNPYTFDDEGYLAESWDFSWWWDSADVGNENKTQLIFTLDDGIYWHDGVKFTSADVKFAIEYYKENLGWWYANVQDVKEIVCPDEHTVMIKLDVTSYWGLHWIGLGVPMFPKHIWETIPDPTIDMPDPTLTGTGMFDFQSYDPDAYVAVFNAFKGDVGSKPYPNAPIRAVGAPRVYTGTKPTGYKVVTRKTAIAEEYLSTLTIELTVKNFMAGATATYTPSSWSGTWTVTTPTTSEGIATTLAPGPGGTPTTLTFTSVNMTTWTSMASHTVSATHNNPVNGFPVDFTSVSVAKTASGDVNGDFALDVLDCLVLSSSFGVLPFGVFTSNADIQGDGLINVIDALLMVNAFAGSWP